MEYSKVNHFENSLLNIKKSCPKNLAILLRVFGQYIFILIAILIQTSKIHWHQLTYTCFLHRHTIDHINCTHRHFIVRNDDELAVLAEFFDHLRELTDVGIIKWRINLIQDTEWSRFDQVDRKQQCRCGQCLFSSTQL